MSRDWFIRQVGQVRGPVSGGSLETTSTQEERDVWEGHPSQITNLKTYILCALFCWLVIPIFVAVYRWLQTHYQKYRLTTQRLITSSGIIAKETHELELYRVKDSALMQTVFERIFKLGTITLKTSDQSSPEVLIESISVNEAKQLREQIRTLTEQLRERKRVREVDYV